MRDEELLSKEKHHASILMESFHQGHPTSNSTSLSQFISKVDDFYGEEVAAQVGEYIRVLQAQMYTRAGVKIAAKAGDPDAAFLVGLTFQFRFVSDHGDCFSIVPPFEKTWPSSLGKAVKYFLIAAESDHPQALYALAFVQLPYNLSRPLDFMYGAAARYPLARKFFDFFDLLVFNCAFINLKIVEAGGTKVSGLSAYLFLRNPGKCTDTSLGAGTANLIRMAIALQKVPTKNLIFYRELLSVREVRLESRSQVENFVYLNYATQRPGAEQDFYVAVAKGAGLEQLVFSCHHVNSEPKKTCKQCDITSEFR